MIYTYDYYKKNITDKSYYFYHFNAMIEIYFLSNEDFEYFDEQEMITKFKGLTYPSDEETQADKIEFILICFYLNDNNYIS